MKYIELNRMKNTILVHVARYLPINMQKNSSQMLTNHLYYL